MQKTLLHNQNILDFSLQTTGSLNSLFGICINNNIGITDEVNVGENYIYEKVDSEDIVNFLQSKEIIIATAAKNNSIEQIETLGIGSMIIETNFIVE